MLARREAVLYNRFRRNILAQRVRAVREYLRCQRGKSEPGRLHDWPTTPLQDAISTDNAAVVHMLLLCGVTAACAVPKGARPLLNQAIRNEQFLVACTMVHASADLDAVDSDGATALHETLRVFRSTKHATVREQALILADMLVFNGAKTDVCDVPGDSVRSILAGAPTQEGFALFKKTMLQHRCADYHRHQTPTR
jgi:hypothetical protein